MTLLKLDLNGSQQLIKSQGEKTEREEERTKLKNVKNKGGELWISARTQSTPPVGKSRCEVCYSSCPELITHWFPLVVIWVNYLQPCY